MRNDISTQSEVSQMQPLTKNENISNLFIRVQIEGKMKEIKSHDSEIAKIWQVIESAEDSKIHFTIIKKYPYEWQTRLE